jgi:hypothetical protein
MQQFFVFLIGDLNMVSPSIRFALCFIVGLLTGVVLGPLFVPDPTGMVAFGLTVVCTVIITGYLYRSDWLRD